MPKTFAIALITSLSVGTIAAVIVNKRPKANTCDLLFAEVVKAKTQEEKSFAEKRWLDTCNGDTTNRL